MKNEGANSPADIFLTVDAARLAKAHELNLFARLLRKRWKSRIPAHLRGRLVLLLDAGPVIVLKGSGGRPRMSRTTPTWPIPKLKASSARAPAPPLQPVADGLDHRHQGEARPKNWRAAWSPISLAPPRAAAPIRSGRSPPASNGVTISNTYYVARLLRSTNRKAKLMEKIAVVWPDQAARVPSTFPVAAC